MKLSHVGFKVLSGISAPINLIMITGLNMESQRFETEECMYGKKMAGKLQAWRRANTEKARK